MLSVLIPLIATINDDVALFQQWHQQVDGGFDWSTSLYQHHHPPAEDACHTHICLNTDAAALLSGEKVWPVLLDADSIPWPLQRSYELLEIFEAM